MKRSISFKIVAVVLAGMVLISTSMPGMSLHFCSGEVAGIAIFDQGDQPDACCLTDNLTCSDTERDDCCKDEYIDLDWNTDLVPMSSSLELDASDFVPAPTPSYLKYLFIVGSGSLPNFKILGQSPTPLRIRFQQFLL